LSEARREAENNPSLENNNNLQQAKAKFLKAKIQARRTSWREKTASLNLEKDGTKLWKLTKQMNDEAGSERGTTTLIDGDSLLTGKQAANKFADNYEDVSNIHISRERLREVRREERERTTGNTKEKVMEKDLTLSELHTALRQLKTKKSPGPDGITNEMLTHLGRFATSKLLDIYNLSWREGKLPQIWREATMIPIHKTGKDRSKASSYRPISLTSVVCKTMERIVNQRLKWHLEYNQLLANQQAGFRQYRSTEDQTTYLAQEIEDAFQEKKVTLVTWIDLQRAFDKVWTDGLLVKLQRNGVGGTMYKWVKSFLFNRKARVSTNGATSRKFLQRHGVPQGGVLSPTLFLIFINDLVSDLPRGIKAALYADDLVLWCSEEHATTATYRMQQAADQLSAWADEWCVQVNTDKSCTTLFTLSPKQKARTINVSGAPLTEVEEATYLGVTFDKRLTWKPHIAHAETKARKKLAILRKLAGTNWGANEEILKTVYLGTIRPHLEYGSPAWMTTSNTNQSVLDKVQNQALRVITGAMKSTPVKAMEQLTSIPPLSHRRDTKALVQASKYEFLPEHPMQHKLQGLTKNRLRRTSFVHKTKELTRRNAEKLGPSILPLNRSDLPKPWNQELANTHISTTVPHLHPTSMDDATKRALTLAMIADEYPPESWTHIYTDGSATAAVKDGGAGIYIQHTSGRIDTVSVATGKHCTNYKAEYEAMVTALGMIEETLEDCWQIVILTDALSVLQALENHKLPVLSEVLSRMSNTRKIALQWIPAHCGIPGNEKADELAKLGAEGDQPVNKISYEEKTTTIKAAMRCQPVKDDYHYLDRKEQVTIFRLRTGHNRLNAHLYKLKLAASPLCSCGLEYQTAEHLLQRCPLIEQQRKRVWPVETNVDKKLYGTVEELQKTTSFIDEAGLKL
jgi:ribonuclease HI